MVNEKNPVASLRGLEDAGSLQRSGINNLLLRQHRETSLEEGREKRSSAQQPSAPIQRLRAVLSSPLSPLLFPRPLPRSQRAPEIAQSHISISVPV